MEPNWGLTGHEWAVNLLRRHAARGEARHAYLFTGPNGSGRRTLALRFAQALNCTNPPAPGEYCGECKECKQIAKMQHPDLGVIELQEGSRQVTVGQVRETLGLLRYKPYQSAYRVILFRHFEEANPSAYNALLKSLEEPPAYAKFLLTANLPEQLAPTIVSRCEVIRLQPLKLETIQGMLEERGADPEKARLIAHISGGRPGFAIRLMSDETFMAARVQRLAELLSLLKSSRVQKFAYAETLTKSKPKSRDNGGDTGSPDSDMSRAGAWSDLRQTYPIWLSFWRDVLLRTTGARVPITNIDYEEQVDALAARLDTAAARKVVADLEQGLDRLEHNVNSRLLTEVLLLDWPKL